MQKKRSPKHLAIIMDGNGRWARQQGMDRVRGHTQGAEVAIATIEACVTREISELTLYALSVENMNRDQREVSFIIKLFVETLLKEKTRLHENGIRVNILGERKAFDSGVLQVINEVEHLTAKNKKLKLNIAFNYSGRWQIKEAFFRAIETHDESTCAIQAYDAFEKSLGKVITSDPDLLIRTGGEMRLSNFMLWHLAYTELFFTEVLWPSFSEETLDHAIQVFKSRDRRFGQIKDDVYIETKKKITAT